MDFWKIFKPQSKDDVQKEKLVQLYNKATAFSNI